MGQFDLSMRIVWWSGLARAAAGSGDQRDLPAECASLPAARTGCRNSGYVLGLRRSWLTAVKMHADELDIDAALVRHFLAAQLPRWAELPIRELPVGGTDNAIFRLGDEISVWLPRRHGYKLGSLDTEFAWLPCLARALPLSIPNPITIGTRGDGYPHEWAINDWLPGDDAASAPLDLPGAAVDLAELLCELWRLSPAGGQEPAGRGGPRAPRDEATGAGIAALAGSIDGEAPLAIWGEALATPSHDGQPTWIHGDLDRRNLLVENGRISDVLD